ncbi:MAG TPA: HNH endonuclease [Kofleriaceae bacterium]
MRRIVKARGALDAQEATALREADALRLWRHYGYSSLLEYMEMEMGYTPRAALERLRVAKAIEELPVIAEKMEQGDLSFSAARELTRVATAETEGEWLAAAEDKNLRQVEDMVSGRKPGDKPTDRADPKLRTRPMRFDAIDDETRALVFQARQIVEREHGERLSDGAFLRMLGRIVIDGVVSPERTKPPYQIAVTLCEQCKRGWQDGGGMTVEMSPPALEVALCDAQHIGSIGTAESFAPAQRLDVEPAESAEDLPSTLTAQSPAQDAELADVTRERNARSKAKRLTAHHDPERAARHDNERAARPDNERAARHDNERAARHDNERAARHDGERATGSVGPDAAGPLQLQALLASQSSLLGSVGTVEKLGRRAKSDIPPALRRKVKRRDHGRCRVPWCRSSRNCDQHHIIPIWLGGEHTEENLLTLCESHHLALHAGALVGPRSGSRPAPRRRPGSSTCPASTCR